MLRILFCISCCNAPPTSRSPKRRASSNPQITRNKNPERVLGEKGLSEGEESTQTSEKGQLLANQIQVNNENHETKNGDSKGKLTLPLAERNKDSKDARYGDRLNRENDLLLTASTSTKLKRAVSDAFDYSDLNSTEAAQSREWEAGDKLSHDGRSASSSSIDIGPFTESNSTTGATSRPSEIVQTQVSAANTANYQNLQQQLPTEAVYVNDGRDGTTTTMSSQRYEPLASASKNVPSTTKIGDYAQIEYSPVEDLDSITTMSYSRYGSEKGEGRSLIGSSLSRQNSMTATTNDGGHSRRSSRGDVESTSISIASQLSNEQLQHNLTNMLESVNSNYPNIDTIGLPLGPSIEGTYPETTKTSPETPGAALTSASQDSLSDTVFGEENLSSSRPGTLRSNDSTGGALVGESFERDNISEEMADLAQPAPIATGEDEDSQLTSNNPRSGGERVGSPQSIATTTSGALTNPTPTPSDVSNNSGKKKKLKAKALFKKLRPGSKKDKNEVA